MTSADLIAELQVARPAAPHALRERVREIAATQPQRRTVRLTDIFQRRFALVAVPALAVVAVSVAGVAGLLDSGSRTPQTLASARTSLEAQPPAAGTTATEIAPQAKSSAADAAAPAGTTPAPTPNRAQRYSAQLTLEVKDLDALSSATQRALQATRDLGGYAVNVSYATATNGTATMTVRVPAAQVQDAIVRLSALGKIVGQQVQIDDLQGQIDELTKQATTLRERIARLSARLASTDITAEVRATLEARRDTARADLARITTSRAQTRAEGQYATIQLSLQTKEQSVVAPTSSRWGDGLHRAGEILTIEAMVVLAVLVIAGPLALLALVAWLVRRGVHRRQDEQLLSAP